MQNSTNPKLINNPTVGQGHNASGHNVSPSTGKANKPARNAG